jgi:putative chitinase
MRLTAAQIVKLFPKCTQQVAQALAEAMPAARIETLPRIAAFLAQVGHESGGLVRLVENLNYSAPGLAATWPGRFTDTSLATRLARNPEAIANYVYANRLGNGDTVSGDGWRYRGRGLIQVTGRANYAEAGKALMLPLIDEPQLLEQPGPAARSACWFWRTRGCNELADADQFMQITRKINGGTHGHAERVALRDRILRALRS